jgi:uncharacterized membrane protein YhiD involved in acid resistance
MNILIVPVVICAAYLVMVSFCVCNRMNAKTSHVVRVAAWVVGGAGSWALCKAVIAGWGSGAVELAQGSAIVVLAVVIGLAPKFRTEHAEHRVTASRKFRHER